jgi:2-C-methyl-D-erythritol 4-phosphate cytidylyltransferase
MQSSQPKQFLPVAGKAILHHTIEAFHKVDPTFNYIIVLPEEYIDYWKNHSMIKKIPVKQTFVAGGKERFYSVKNALSHVGNSGIVAIHDGVRPLVSKKTIKACIEKAKDYGNAVPVLPMTDSVRQLNEQGSAPLNRELLRIVQTPQCFEINLLRRAYETEYSAEYTDDASVVERLGTKIQLVEGNRENIKITNPEDIRFAEYYLGQK